MKQGEEGREKTDQDAIERRSKQKKKKKPPW
jgi:hypothetical protein